MKIKASVDYGIRTVLYLALSDGVRSSREISEEMGVPRDYLIQLALHLRKAGIVKARPGKNGGYELARKPSQISIGEIIGLFDDVEHQRSQMKKRKKTKDASLSVYEAHKFVLESLDDYLDSITIQTFIDMVQGTGNPSLLIADALEDQAAKLRAQAKKKDKA